MQAQMNFIMTCRNLESYYNSIKDTCPVPTTINGKRIYFDGTSELILLKD